MVGIKLKEFQEQCVSELLESTTIGETKEILIDSPTGSGKTIILIEYIDRFLSLYKNYAIIWLTPGTGDLEDQSMKKMQKYTRNRDTKTLDDVLINGIREEDTAFVNWETVTKKGNTALKEQERKNLFERIADAKREGIKFIVIIDEEHRNKTDKAEAIIQEFEAEYIIRVSATVKRNDEAKHIVIDELDVISSGLITRALYINEGIENNKVVDNELEFLLQLAIDKQKAIRNNCIESKIRYNPLVIIQIPSQSDELIRKIEKYLEKQGFTYDNNTVAIWLADRKERIDNIEENMAEQCFLIMKQAISTGWDCPRAKILVKLRENMNEEFEIQTLGRIRRMPEAKHYENELLDNCYLYTFDSNYTEKVKQELGKNASDVKLVFIKNEYRDFSLTKELKDNEVDNFAPRTAFEVIYDYFMKKYDLSTKTKENVLKLENAGYNFSPNLLNEIVQGKVIELKKENIENDDKIKVESIIDTHRNGLDLKHAIGVISSKVGMIYQNISPVLQRLFLSNIIFGKKILNLTKKEFYAFIINNQDRLKHDILEAVAQKRDQQAKLKLSYKKTAPFKFPDRMIVKYDADAKETNSMNLSIYNDYPSSSKKSSSERKFEKYCEESGKFKFWYKNGESSQEFFSIIYIDKMNKAWTFYPDYIVQDSKGCTWIIETKGGEDASGNSKNIDIKVENKFEVLKNYANTYNLRWGFVRDKDEELYISFADEYVEDMKDESWINIKNVF